MEHNRQLIEELVLNQSAIRNIAIIAHIDHGKTTVCDNFVKKAGISNKERYIDSVRDDQTERIITIKSTGMTLAFNVGDQYCPSIPKNKLFLSLVDSPGHVDFSCEVTSAIRLTDGALVVVDCISGIAVQTETVLKQAIEERVTPVLLLNKLDRAFLELKRNPEELYRDLKQTIDRTNMLIQTLTPSDQEPAILDPCLGNVAFGSGKQGWIFTLKQFAQVYAKGADPQKFLKYLWGDWFYDTSTKKWHTTPVYDGRTCERGFVKFILGPLYKVCQLCQGDLEQNCGKLENIVKMFLPNETNFVKSAIKAATGKDLLANILSQILPAADTILSMIQTHIPSPLTAQQKRAAHLYTGDQSDSVAQAICKCDREGPVMVYITKMVSQNKSFLAYGRILSGTLTSGQKVTILGSDYHPQQTPPKDFWPDVIIKSIKLSLAKDFVTISKAYAGTIVCIGGLDRYIDKAATLTTAQTTPLYPIQAMKFTVAPVVRMAVTPKNVSDLPKLKEGLNILAKSSTMVGIGFDESTKQFIIEGVGELHLEILMKDLAEYSNCELKVSQPIVPFRETVTTLSPVCLVKSANKLNRIYATAEPISPDLLVDMQSGRLEKMNCDNKLLTKYLVEKHGWTQGETKKIWAFGPDVKGGMTNILVDQTKGAEYLNEIKDSLINAFQTVCQSGVLAQEPLIGVKFNITEVKVHTDNSHRSSSQIIPAAHRLFRACQLSANPRLVEPTFEATLKFPSDQLGNVYGYISNKRTTTVDEQHENLQVKLVVNLPVLESFGFDAGLKAATSGKCFPSLNFSHWQTLDSDPIISGSMSNKLVLETRTRKKMLAEIPGVESLVDRL